MVRCVRPGLLFFTLVALTGCREIIWVDSGHPATTPDQIQILTQVPDHYERLGTVTHLYMDNAPWQEGMDGAAIIQDLLTEAGAMGSNALVLHDDTTMASTSISVTYKGQTYKLPVIGKTKTVVAQGIFTK